MAERKDLIDITTMYGARSHEPAVILKWGAESGQLTVAEARKHALRLLEAAESAEQDGFMADWFRTFGHADDATVAQLLHEFRRARTIRAEKEGGI